MIPSVHLSPEQGHAGDPNESQTSTSLSAYSERNLEHDRGYSTYSCNRAGDVAAGLSKGKSFPLHLARDLVELT